jgi:predicted nucleic acid-binding protein
MARRVVRTYIAWCLQPETGDIDEAFRIEDEVGISFWDALILAAAARSGATRVLSEDLNAGQIISGVTVVNPFDQPEKPPQAKGGQRHDDER